MFTTGTLDTETSPTELILTKYLKSSVVLVRRSSCPGRQSCAVRTTKVLHTRSAAASGGISIGMFPVGPPDDVAVLVAMGIGGTGGDDLD